jgi:hypothetical protein
MWIFVMTSVKRPIVILSAQILFAPRFYNMIVIVSGYLVCFIKAGHILPHHLAYLLLAEPHFIVQNV